MSSFFTSTLNTIESNFTDRKTREEIEGFAIGAASFAVAEEIPVIGEVQLAGQILDFFDPFGYNQALSEDAINTLVTKSINSILASQATGTACYQSGDITNQACVDAGISADDMKTFLSLSSTGQNQKLASINSWTRKTDPLSNNVPLYICTLQSDLTDISDPKRCSVPQYTELFSTYWNNNLNAYQNNLTGALQSAAAAQTSALQNEITQQEQTQDATNQKKLSRLKSVLIAATIIVFIVIYLIVNKIVK